MRQNRPSCSDGLPDKLTIQLCPERCVLLAANGRTQIMRTALHDVVLHTHNIQVSILRILYHTHISQIVVVI